MEPKNKYSNLQQDDQLADFADQVMQGKPSASSSTDDLLALKETILRLNNSLPPASLDEATVKQMHVRLKARIRREEQDVKPSFWKKWFGREISPQLGLAFAALAVLVIAIVSIPSLTSLPSSTAGTASTPVNLFVAAGLAGVFLLILWVMRRK
ncbi:MAG: hypothetical protein IH588_16325 [Anaerolineales bacterium]|nr:hypothetical protein [Anaerolineales bacterium]